MKTFIASIVLGIVAWTVIVSLFASLFVLYRQNKEMAIALERNSKQINDITLLLNNTDIQWQH